MLRRLLLLFLITFSLSLTSVFANCFFDSYSDTCPRFSEPFQEFTIDFSSQEIVDNYSVILYNKYNPSNRLATSVNGDTIRNVNPFVDSGVYVLELRAKTYSNLLVYETQEFIFDNSELQVPRVPLSLDTDSTSSTIRIQGLPQSSVIATLQDGTTFSSQVSTQGVADLDITLSQGINVVYFHTELDSKVSQKIPRIIYVSVPENDNAQASAITVDDLAVKNERTFLEGETYVTSSQYFLVSGFVSGSSMNGAQIVVQGSQERVDLFGNFASFVLLNEGLNEVEIVSGDVVETVSVLYTRPRFVFANVDYDKIVDQVSTSIDVEVNYQLPFEVYVNGDLNSVESPSSQDHRIFISGLKEGKNYITLKGYGGELYSDFIYRDSESPSISYEGFDSLSSADELVFLIRDDLSVDLDSFVLTLGSQTYDGSDIEFKGDYAFVSLDDIADGTYSYSASIKDLVGKESLTSGTLDISSSNTVLDNILIDEGDAVGDTLFVSSDEQTLIFIPSKTIAFDKIFLDGNEVVSYEIKRDGTVEVTLAFEREQGELELRFINSAREYFTQTFTYVSDNERPTFELDYVSSPYTTSQKTVLVSGKVLDSYFNWDSLEFNGVSQFIRFGDYVEAFVPVTISGEVNLVVSGRDVVGNTFEEAVIGSLLYLDTTDTSFSYSTPSLDAIEGSIINSPQEVQQHVTSYDGITSYGIILGSDFELGVGPRQGIRSVNMKGNELSGNDLRSIEAISIDDKDPKIYFFDNSGFQIVIDGTLSLVDVSSIEIDVNSIPLSVLSSCNTYSNVGVYDTCRRINVQDGDLVEVRVSDEQGNQASRSVTVGDYDEAPSQFGTLDFYFVGNDKLLKEDTSFLQGQIFSVVPPREVSVDGKSCLFDDLGFVCYVDVEEGDNSYDVTVLDEAGQSVTKNYTLTRVVGDDLSVSLDDLQNAAIFNVNGEYYTLLSEVDVLGTTAQESFVTLIIDGKEIPVGEESGSFIIDVDLSDFQAGKNREELDIQLQVEDELGNEERSNTLTLVFSRFAETIIDIFIG